MSKLKLIIVNSLWIFLLAACSSQPTSKSPDWTHQPTRLVDNGYIVYVGRGDGPNQESAQFKAEGMALEDIANECSFIPKGTRVEDRYVEKKDHDSTAWIKIALEFQECDQASKTTDPSEIKEIANASFTGQMKRYQDFNETGETPDPNEAAEVDPLSEIPPAPMRPSGWSDSTHFYVVRQYIAFQNQVVILSPPTAYRPGSPEAKVYTTQMQAPRQQVHTAIVANPQLKAQPQAWSSIPDRPKVARPANLQAKPNRQVKSLQVPAKNSDAHQRRDGHHKGQGRKRKVHNE